MKLSFENLESRDVMSGNVVASVSGGDLSITGDSGSNYIFVTQLDADSYRVMPVDGSLNWVPSWAAPNGQVFHGVVDDIWVDMNAGNDTVLFSGSTAGNWPNRVRFLMDSGDDYLSVGGLHNRNYLEIRGGNDDDRIVVGNSNVGTDLNILTDRGHDEVALNNVIVGDDLMLSAVDPGSLSLDLAVTDIWVGDSGNIAGSNGRDTVTIKDADLQGLFTINTRGGNDSVEFENFRNSGRTQIYLGDGVDSFDDDDDCYYGEFFLTYQ